jgi:CHAD domain-containing protein
MTGPAGVWLGERHRKARKAGRQVRKLDPEQRHRLRISFKKLRYTADFFRGLYQPGAVRPYLEAVEGLQEVLGDLNDAAVSCRLAEVLAGEADRGMRDAVKAFTEWLDRGTRRRLAELPDRWREFEKVEPFWTEG